MSHQFPRSCWILCLLATATAATAQTTTRVYVGPGGAETTSWSDAPASDGYGCNVAFVSRASNLVSNDTKGVEDIFLYSCTTGKVERVSVADNGAQANAGSLLPSINHGGTKVAFQTAASNLVPGDTNGASDI